MMSRPNLDRYLLLCLLSALAAAAQLTSASLRAKFGAPLNRTFHTPQGLELIASYGVGNRVCRLDVRPGALPAKKISNPKQEIDNLLADLLPLSVRGKKQSTLYQPAGPWLTISTTEYEHLSISEANPPAGEVVRVTFNDCR